MGKCILCQNIKKEISSFLSLCGACIRDKFSQAEKIIRALHRKLGRDLPLQKEKKETAPLFCNLCINQCSLREGRTTLCGLRILREKKIYGPDKDFANLEFYFDWLPTNCVATPWCGVQADHPNFSWENPRQRYKNLAIFFNGCSFNCLFCQNYSYRSKLGKFNNLVKVSELVEAVDSQTACICFFGGDPSCQIDFTINFSQKLLELFPKRILRICWETNGSFNPHFREKILEILLKSGGIIKFDLKFFSKELNLALCGSSNELTFENFSFFATSFLQREKPPLLCASTLVIPGYVDEIEVENIVKFIARFNKDIPYSLLGFWPSFYFNDLPPTPKELMYSCYRVAKKYLNNVNIGNKHLLW